MPEMTYARAVALVEGLVRIPSLSTQEADATAWLVEQMRALGYARAWVDEAGNAVGELGRVDARWLFVLLGHIDTVPGDIPVRKEPGDGGEILFGRGSVDAKGPLAAFVAAGALLGHAWALANDVRVVVVGAVEEEYATSKGARAVAARFDGTVARTPDACIIGEPSGWSRVTLGYKGRILIEIDASKPMAHTAGPDAGIGTAAFDFWRRVVSYAATCNQGRERAFDQLQPSIRRIVTSTDEAMHDHVVAEVGIRLPVDFPLSDLVVALDAWAAEYAGAASQPVADGRAAWAHTARYAGPDRMIKICFRGAEIAYKEARTSPLARAMAAAIRTFDPDVRPVQLVKTGTSDMNVVAPLWNCPIVAYGPGDSGLDHTPNEHLSLSEYWKSVQILTNCLRDLSGFLA